METTEKQLKKFLCPWCDTYRNGAQFLVGKKKHRKWVCNDCFLKSHAILE